LITVKGAGVGFLSFFSSPCWYIEFLNVPCSLNDLIVEAVFAPILIDIIPLLLNCSLERNSAYKYTSFLHPGTKLKLIKIFKKMIYKAFVLMTAA
jgi:hypothetical protein